MTLELDGRVDLKQSDSFADMKRDYLAFAGVAVSTNGRDLLASERDALLEDAEKGNHRAKIKAFALLDYLLASKGMRGPEIFKEADDWAKGLLNQEKYVEWKQYREEKSGDGILDQFDAMFKFMENDEHTTLYGEESIPHIKESVRLYPPSKLDDRSIGGGTERDKITKKRGAEVYDAFATGYLYRPWKKST